jgi:hypothetical protein
MRIPQLQTEQRTPAEAPARGLPAPLNVTPVVVPVTIPSVDLASALASCDEASAGAELPALPGVKGEIRLDRCYRGRDNSVCAFNALLIEAQSLLQSYQTIVNANYPTVGDVDGICRIKPDTLVADFQGATEFATRFKALKAAYEARSNCATRVQQAFREVTLPDMPQASEILKSIIDAISGDMNGVSAVQGQVVELAKSIDASQKAMTTIQRVYRTMCRKDQRAVTDAEGHASR